MMKIPIAGWTRRTPSKSALYLRFCVSFSNSKRHAREFVEEYWTKQKKEGKTRKSLTTVKRRTSTAAISTSAKTRRASSLVNEGDSESEAAASPPPKKRTRLSKSNASKASKAPKTSKSSKSSDDLDESDAPTIDTSLKAQKFKSTSAARGRQRQSEASDSMDVEKPKTASTARTRKAQSPVSDYMDVEKIVNMKEWAKEESWEHLVERIDTVEQNGDDITVYFRLYVSVAGAEKYADLFTVKITRASARSLPKFAGRRCRKWYANQSPM